MTKEQIYQNLVEALLNKASDGVRITDHAGGVVVLVGDRHYHLDSWKTKERQARDLTNWLNELKDSCHN